MSPNEDATRQARALRAAAVRQATGLSNKDFAAEASRIARELGLATNYDPSLISKIVGALRDVSIDDVLVLMRLDPDGRGFDWFALGTQNGAGKAAKRTPIPDAPRVPSHPTTHRGRKRA